MSASRAPESAGLGASTDASTGLGANTDASTGLGANTDASESRSKGGRRIALFVAAAALVGGAWFFLRAADQAPLTRQVAAVEPAKPSAARLDPAKVEPAPAPSAAPTQEPTPTPSASNEPVTAVDPTPPADGLIVVTVSTVPEDARFFYKGKPVGRSPFRVELKRGQRRSFEIGRPGFHARKVVVDGTKSEMTVSMKPEIQGPTAPAAAAPSAPE